MLAALLAAACNRGGTAPPAGELRSALAIETLSGAVYDPSTTEGISLVTFWAPG